MTFANKAPNPTVDASVHNELLNFITDRRRMRMSHIYQPVMLMTLLRNDGSATVEQIAREFLVRDQSQVEYYSHITKVMPGRVLGKNHGLVEKVHDQYLLRGFDSLTACMVQKLGRPKMVAGKAARG